MFAAADGACRCVRILENQNPTEAAPLASSSIFAPVCKRSTRLKITPVTWCSLSAHPLCCSLLCILNEPEVLNSSLPVWEEETPSALVTDL